MAKKRTQQKKKKTKAQKKMMRQLRSSQKNRPQLTFSSYEITDEPINAHTIPEEVQDEMETIFELTHKSPELIVDRLEEFVSKYPEVPQLYNFLSVAYSNMNDKEKSTYYIKKNCEINPDYLFAKLNYAEICLIEGNYQKIPEIFDHKFDLKALYPERDVFHITEVTGFAGVVGKYFLKAGMKEQAALFYDLLKKIAPDHRHTKELKKDLFRNAIGKSLKKMIRRR